MAFELAPSGVSVTLVELPAVDTGVFDAAPRYLDERYAPLAREIDATRFPSLTPEQAATAIADATEADTVPLRIPVGAFTKKVIEQIRGMPDDRPAVALPIRW